MSPDFKGVYSTQSAFVPSLGKRTATQKRLWLVWEQDAATVVVQSLNKNLVPFGQKRLVARGEFERDYTSEPDFVLDRGNVTVRPLWKRDGVTEAGADFGAPEGQAKEQGEKVDLDQEPLIDRDEEVPSPAAPLPAPPPPPSVEQLEQIRVEREARTAFALGLSHLQRGNKDRARELFKQVADMEVDFAYEYKHMFNEFGINLRKSAMPELALEHYRRALALSPDDEHLRFNMARVYWDLGDMRNCEKYLNKSLEINPGLEYAARFLRYLRKHPKQKTKLFEGLLPFSGGKKR